MRPTRIGTSHHHMFSKKTKEKVAEILKSMPPEELSKTKNLHGLLVETMDQETLREVVEACDTPRLR